MKQFGLVIVFVGILWAIIAFFMDTTVRTDSKFIGSGAYSSYIPSTTVHNIGLIERRRTHLTLAGFTTLAGVILFGFGSTSRTTVSGPTRTCPKCAETILAAASKCRYCGSTVEPLLVEPLLAGKSESNSVVAGREIAELERLLQMIESGNASLDTYENALKCAGGSLKVGGSLFNPRYILTLGDQEFIIKVNELLPWFLANVRPLASKDHAVTDDTGTKVE